MNALRFVLVSTFAACSLANAGSFEKVSEAKEIVLGVRDSTAPLNHSGFRGGSTPERIES